MTTLIELGTTGQEIDRQIATARAFPRSIEAFHKTATGLVTLDETVAAECIYLLPRAGKEIEGASSRFAEILATAWGNCRYGARVVGEDNDFVIAQGIFHDLQTNACVTVDVQRRIVDAKGRRFNVDMIGVTANAACSIAIRNAILKGIPKALWQGIYETARRTAAGSETTLTKRRDAALKAFEDRGIKPARLFEALGIPGIEDLNLGHLVTLRGYINAINDGEATIADYFPAPAIVAPSPTAGQPVHANDLQVPATPSAARPGANAKVTKSASVTRDRNVAPRFDQAEAAAYMDDFRARLAQCPTQNDITDLAEEFASQAVNRLSKAHVNDALAFIDAARSLLEDKPQ